MLSPCVCIGLLLKQQRCEKGAIIRNQEKGVGVYGVRVRVTESLLLNFLDEVHFFAKAILVLGGILS